MHDRQTGNERSRLASLARVIREVDSAPDLETALRVVVERTRALMAADVCSIYFTEHDRRRHVIVATAGLAPTVVGQVQFGFGKGLVGRVAESAKPINLDHVPDAPHQEFVRQSGAGPFHGFLGVPISHRGEVLGVLVVRQRAERRFDDTDTAVLTTLAAQLGGAIAYAKASGTLRSPERSDDTASGQLEGLAGAPGIAVGTGVVIFPPAELGAVPDRQPDDPGAEERRLRAAIAQVQAEVRRLGDDPGGMLSAAERALFDAYGLILDSPELVAATVQRIHLGNWAAGALRHTIETYIRRFDAMDDPYLRERGADIRELGTRILVHLQGTAAANHDHPANTILIGRQLGAIDLGLAPRERLRGIISTEGSALSHVAILARALGIPAVVGVGNVALEQLDSQEVVVDGHRGRVYLKPNPSLRKEIERLIRDQREIEAYLGSLRNLSATTRDGVDVALHTNAGLLSELPLIVAAGSAGIGLFRSELPFMLYDRFPGEQEQVDIYRQVLKAVAPLPVNLRTLDVGGDKPLPYLPMTESNPMLGWRGIRLTLDHPEIFLTQLRAALRASVGLGNLRLLLPMISGVAEVEQAFALLDQARCQLLEEGVAASRPPVGLMIEVPSAIYQAEELARRVDFLSIGSNDLAQYLLAIDRANPKVSARLDPLHPAVLRALRQVVEASERAGTPLAVCGEIAGDPGCALLLLGMGVNSLSVNAGDLPRVKWAIRSVDFPHLESLARQALALEKPEAIRRLLEQALQDAGLGRLRSPAQAAIGDENVPG